MSRQLVTDHFRCAEDLAEFPIVGELSKEAGYFRLGKDAICYGQCSSAAPARSVTDALPEAESLVSETRSVQLPFNAAQVVDNLRLEKYFSDAAAREKGGAKAAIRSMYYLVRPLMPVAVRKHFQKMYLRGWDTVPFPSWPVDGTVEAIFDRLLYLSMKACKVDRVPFIWFWPDGAPSCAIMTHDVETSAGVDFCPTLMDLNDSFGIKSSFQVVPEKRYPVPAAFLESIRQRGFEVNVHDLNHDGHLFDEREEFLRRAERINNYGRQFGALGFRSAVLYRKVEWFDALKFSYDMSIPNVAHLDPQRGGCCTVRPFFIGDMVELPVTAIQDYSLFNILNDYSTRIWKDQISRIRQKNGLISFIIHPDYIIDEAARRVYADLLQHLSDLRAKGETWIALPREAAMWWRQRSRMKLVDDGGSLRVEGEGAERARIAYAVIDGDKIAYQLAGASGRQVGV
jgi:hypothetical protein